MTTSHGDLGDTLKCIAANAPKLRKAGVLRVSVDGVSFEMEPDYGDGKTAGGDVDESAVDAMNDGATYHNGRVPGFKRPSRDDE